MKAETLNVDRVLKFNKVQVTPPHFLQNSGESQNATLPPLILQTKIFGSNLFVILYPPFKLQDFFAVTATPITASPDETLQNLGQTAYLVNHVSLRPQQKKKLRFVKVSYL